MTKNHETFEVILIWMGVISSFITLILPYFQFIAIVMAIAVSYKKLWPKKHKNNV